MTSATHGMSGRPLKTRVSSNLGAPYARRFFNHLWTYRVSQLTTSNVRRLKDTGISMSMMGDGGGQQPKKEMHLPVKSDLQPHAMHRFTGEADYSLLVAIPKSSDHFVNATECAKVSLMFGHTDPQIFHFFKQLGTLPPRSLISGVAEVLSGDLLAECWSETFSRHPTIHALAQEMWETQESKTEAEAVHIAKRHQEEDEKRMRRMSSSDWRAKFKERERNPTAREDVEEPIYVIKPETFAVLRVKPDVKLWMNVASQTQRVWEPVIPPPDPLCRCSHRFIRMLNLGRQKLVPSLNLNFSLKLTNAFIFEIDDRGLWALGTQENFTGQSGAIREEWTELRLEFGKGQVIENEQEMEWWVRGFTKLGAPEMTQTDSSIEDAGMNPEDFDYRHI